MSCGEIDAIAAFRERANRWVDSPHFNGRAAKLRTSLASGDAALTTLNLATKNSVPEDTRRDLIDVALGELGEAPEQVSIELGLVAGYLRTFLERGWPRTLPSRVRRRLAAYLGVPEQALR
jgi:hypothetical protein